MREAMERAGDVIGEGTLANNEGEILSDQGHLEGAEDAFRHMLRTSRAAGYLFGAAVCTSNLARVAARGRRFEEARALYADALAQFTSIDARYYLADTRARLAECDVLEGRYAEAIELATATLADEHAGGPRADPGRARARVCDTPGEAPRRGSTALRGSLRLAREAASDYEAALTLRALADTGDTDADSAGAEAHAVLARLGVVQLPKVPLP